MSERLMRLLQYYLQLHTPVTK